jgi:hypothetical protein
MNTTEKKYEVQEKFRGILGEKVVLEYVEDEDAQKTYIWMVKDANGEIIAFPEDTILKMIML